MSLNFQKIPNNNNLKNFNTKVSYLSNNSEIKIPLNLDLNNLKILNNKSAELIFEGKIDEGLKILKRLEYFLESNIFDPKKNFEKKVLIIILHNISCCCQKLKDLDNCICYLESVIFHYDLAVEKKHNIKISEIFLIQHLKENKDNCWLLGDLILEMRFSAKFHLQISSVLSQANRHVDALNHAKLASIICEDNLIKTYYLSQKINTNNISSNNNDEDSILFNEKIKLNSKIIYELYTIIINLEKYKNITKTEQFINKATDNKNEYFKENNINNFNSYLDYRLSEIKNFNSKNSLINRTRNILCGTIEEDDWIKLLNIENILFLAPLNYEDLDLDSDPRYELLRDTILEKIVMLTVSYFCIAREMKFLSNDKNNRRTNGELYLSKAIELSSMFLPVSCPIIKNYITSYYKNYGQNMDIIPEGKIFDMKVILLKNEIEQNKDILSFVKLKKINYLNKVQDNNNLNENSNNNQTNKNINLNSISIPRLYINSNINSLINTMNISENKINNLTNKVFNNSSTNTNINTSINTNINTNFNSNINTNSNSNKKNTIKNKNKNSIKSCEKFKKNVKPKNFKKNYSKPISNNNSFQINHSHKSSKSLKSNKALVYVNSFNTKNKNNKNKYNPIRKNEKNYNVMRINNRLNIKSIDILPNQNFLNVAKKSKIEEKLAPKFKLNFTKLNKSQNVSDDNDNEFIYNFNYIINSKNDLLTKYCNTNSNRSSKINTELNIELNKEKKIGKKDISINLNSNFYLNMKDLKSERLKNKKYYKNNNNFLDNKFDKNLSPKYNFTSILIKKKEKRGNHTDRITNRNKVKIKKCNHSHINSNNNSNSNIKINNINNLKINFNSPIRKNPITKSYRHIKHDKNKQKKKKYIFGNNSFKNNIKRKNFNLDSIRYQYNKNKIKQNNSKSYYINTNGNNTNNNNNNFKKDISVIKSMEFINKFFFNKNNISSKKNAFQRQFKNKINLNKHHLNGDLVTHFKNMNF